MPRKRTLLIVGDSNILVSLPVIFVLEEVGGGSDVFVQVFLKGHALIHSGKWEGHDFFRKKFLKYPTQPPPPNKIPTFPRCPTVKNFHQNATGRFLKTSKEY